MRNMSFFLTTQQFRDHKKTVTRRLGWKNAKTGWRVMGVVKCQGLKRGEKIERLGPVAFAQVTRERLDTLITSPEYGRDEVKREGFPELSPHEFVRMFCKHNHCRPSSKVTRIAFRYIL